MLSPEQNDAGEELKIAGHRRNERSLKP